jgi:hypothetical protein
LLFLKINVLKFYNWINELKSISTLTWILFGIEIKRYKWGLFLILVVWFPNDKIYKTKVIKISKTFWFQSYYLILFKTIFECPWFPYLLQNGKAIAYTSLFRNLSIIFEVFGTHRDLNTVYHPEPDSQTGRGKPILVDLLRASNTGTIRLRYLFSLSSFCFSSSFLFEDEKFLSGGECNNPSF